MMWMMRFNHVLFGCFVLFAPHVVHSQEQMRDAATIEKEVFSEKPLPGVIIDPPGVPIPKSLENAARQDAITEEQIEGYLEERRKIAQGEATENGPRIPTPMPVTKHFVFNDGAEITPGPTPTPFINTEKLIGEFNTLWQESQKDFPTADQFTKSIMESIEEPVLGRCLENKTDSIPISEQFPEGLLGDKSPYQDYLFIEGAEYPQDTDIIFGPTTITVPFVRGTPNKGWEYVSAMGVSCLPFRVRLQGKRMYVDRGLPALKNYSQNPKGEYHPYIRSLYKIGSGNEGN
jgi:hypothetical protein